MKHLPLTKLHGDVAVVGVGIATLVSTISKAERREEPMKAHEIAIILDPISVAVDDVKRDLQRYRTAVIESELDLEPGEIGTPKEALPVFPADVIRALQSLPPLERFNLMFNKDLLTPEPVDEPS